MRKLLLVGAAAAMGLWATVASADQVTGPISKIDLTRDSFIVRGMYFTASPTNTVGTKLSQLKNGDRVTVEYAGDPASQRWPTNAMELKKAN
jgi:hypothetical protein